MILDNEYKAIFELNNKSPLFTRVAFDAISAGEFEKALSILKNGIELFEEYPTPFFLMGDLLVRLGKIEEAEDAFQKGNLLLNNSATLEFYLNSFSTNIDITTNDIEPTSSKNSDDDLTELADKLKTAKIEINHEDDSASNDSNKSESKENFKPLKGLVSETLASIYFNQANYKEAKAIYETLIDIQPERTEYFKNKLSEIDSKMRA
ncbi:MAG: hypothetical protein L3J41_14230 [Melioribacteraceae bacterium]|nr:hypothetical protein [Melioribacteraceae bacterium]